MKKRRYAALFAAAIMAVGSVFQGNVGGARISALSTVEAYAADSYSKDTEGFVTRMYSVVLGRTPDATGLKNWTAKLNNHTTTASDIIYGFFCSDEYKGKNKSGEEIVTDCYNAMLDRNPDSTGKENWLKRLNVGMTTMAVCKGFVGSSEFKGLCSSYGIEPGTINLSYARDENYERTYFVYRLYANCLGRTPDIAGLENWCKNLKNGMTGTKIAQGFIFSDEYKGRNTSNTEFATMLYNTILGRAPDTSGLSSWTNQLNIGRSRQFVTNGFLFSSEFKGQCSTAGITLSSAPASSEYRYGTAPTRYSREGLTYIGGMLIANKSYSLPSDFNPGLDSTCMSQFNKLVSAASAQGLNIYLSSGFRSYSYQAGLYNSYVSWYGQAAADTFSARPGHSEHQCGLAIDVNSIDSSFDGTPEAIWLAAHCHEYGFIIRYQKGKQDITGYKYEPWHIRYVGTDLAYQIAESGLTVEEYFGITSRYAG